MQTEKGESYWAVEEALRIHADVETCFDSLNGHHP